MFRETPLKIKVKLRKIKFNYNTINLNLNFILSNITKTLKVFSFFIKNDHSVIIISSKYKEGFLKGL